MDCKVKRTGGGPKAQRRSRGSTEARKGAGRHARLPGRSQKHAAASQVCNAGMGQGAPPSADSPRSILPEKDMATGAERKAFAMRAGETARGVQRRDGDGVPAYSWGAPKLCVVTHSESSG